MIFLTKIDLQAEYFVKGVEKLRCEFIVHLKLTQLKWPLSHQSVEPTSIGNDCESRAKM